MNGLTYAATRGFSMGAKYGLVKGFRMYHSAEETPEMDESAMQGAIGIIIAVGGVLIALYIIAVVVGSISYSVTSGNIKLSTTWNTTITNHVLVEKNNNKIVCEKNEGNCSKSQTDGYTWVNIDSQAQATFNLAKFIILKELKQMEVLLLGSKGPCVTYSDYRRWYPDDRYWGILRSWHLTKMQGLERIKSSLALTNTKYRTSKVAIA
jgi:hypothetical protein